MTSEANPEQVVAVHRAEERQIARPLHVLVRLIKDDLRKANDAARQAGMPRRR